MMVWGEADAALGKETTYGTDAYVSNLRINYLPGISHWVQQDAPDEVNALLQSFLSEPAVQEA
jgi:pimeloyl-ACP methyl ester carboxylesterase